MPATRTAWLQIHLCVFLWGFTAVFGRLITLPALPLVMWRMALVAVLLFCLPQVWRGVRALSRRHFWAFSGVGVLVALHWLSFYGAVKLANASVAATCMATIPVFLCVIEPLVTGRAFSIRELVLGLLVLPGIALVVGGTPQQMNVGVATGIVSALMAALFTAYNKRLIHRTDALSATALEMASGAVLVFAVAGVLALGPEQGGDGAFLPASTELFLIPAGLDLVYLLLLGLACTLLPFALSLRALRHLSAYASALAVNLEPLYAMTLAILFLGEQRELGLAFYGGAAIILGVVFIYPLIFRPRAPAPLV
ncbi:MAG: DMT family transporter [Pseudomonadales bacterium]|nr:DMT family transporter [Pseudomonadales bacterium]MCP5330995.1 DMT family transporter [Pseudomonadales bacterium]MCP5344625.1 DMT family transporter [Pseudomonadales bacterium]